MLSSLKSQTVVEVSFSALSQFLLKSIALSLLIALSAQVSIPMWPVPMTFHVPMIFSMALLLSPALTLGATLTYLIEVMMGLPVLSGFKSSLLGPTIGYVVGFIPAAFVISKFKDNCLSVFSLFALCLVGQIILYSFGVFVLSFHVGGFSKAWLLGVVPFVLNIPLSCLFAISTSAIFKKIKR